MTCEQVRAITSRPMDDATRAERMAAVSHAAKCADCMAWILSPDRPQDPFKDDEEMAACIELYFKDRQDPEVAN
jgi:hypothetical protein